MKIQRGHKPNFPHQMPSPIQHIGIHNNRWQVELTYDHSPSNGKEVNPAKFTRMINLQDSKGLSSLLYIRATNRAGEIKTCHISGVQGSSGLYTCDETNKGQRIKLYGDRLAICVDFVFFMLDLNKLEIEWKIKAEYDIYHAFYDLKEGYLLHGELEVHGIDGKGNIKWSHVGEDIWVNIHGKEEAQIKDDQIILTDFSYNVYVLDITGPKHLEKKDIKLDFSGKKWYQFWK
jgi:hypothetical protein